MCRWARSGLATHIGGSVSTEAARWLDGLEFGEVEFADGLECLGGCAVVQAWRHRLLLGGILRLERHQHGDGVTPTLGAAAQVAGAAEADDRFVCVAGRPVAGLAFGVGHRPVADRLAWHGQLRIVT